MSFKISLAAVALVTLQACGGSEPPADADADEPNADEHVWQDQTGALERAREAEDKLKEAAERTREAVEDP